MLNLRKVALVAAIALAVARGYWIGSQIWMWTQIPGPRWLGALVVPGGALFLLPMPLLLYLLYRSGGNIAVSRDHRRLALVPAMFQAEIVVSRTYRMLRMLSADLDGIQQSSGTTVASRIAEWFATSNSWPQFWNLVLLFAESSVLWFLIALIRGRRRVRESETRRLYWLREIAALTTIIGGFAVILGVGQYIPAFVEARRNPEGFWLVGVSVPQFIVRAVFNIAPQVCMMLLAWIIYKSVPAQTAEIATE